MSTAQTNIKDFYRKVPTPVGFEPLELEMDPTDIQVDRLLSGTECTKGDLLQRSGGFYVPADNATKPGEDPVIAMETLSATDTTNNEIEVWTGFRKGKRARAVTAGAVASTSRGAWAVLDSTDNTLLVSGAAVGTALFLVTDVLNLTDKIIVVTLNRGQNS